MVTITVSFPYHIAVMDVERYLELELKQNTDYRCEVLFEFNKGEENFFTIFANSKEALYGIGMLACKLKKQYAEITCI